MAPKPSGNPPAATSAVAASARPRRLGRVGRLQAGAASRASSRATSPAANPPAPPGTPATATRVPAEAVSSPRPARRELVPPAPGSNRAPQGGGGAGHGEGDGEAGGDGAAGGRVQAQEDGGGAGDGTDRQPASGRPPAGSPRPPPRGEQAARAGEAPGERHREADRARGNRIGVAGPGGHDELHGGDQQSQGEDVLDREGGDRTPAEPPSTGGGHQQATDARYLDTAEEDHRVTGESGQGGAGDRDQQGRLLTRPAIGGSEGEERRHQRGHHHGQPSLIGAEHQRHPGHRVAERGHHRTAGGERRQAQGGPPGQEDGRHRNQPPGQRPGRRQDEVDQRPDQQETQDERGPVPHAQHPRGPPSASRSTGIRAPLSSGRRTWDGRGAGRGRPPRPRNTDRPATPAGAAARRRRTAGRTECGSTDR